MASWNESLRNLGQRSVALHTDPKMMEMRNFLSSHAHEERLREKADLTKDEREREKYYSEAERMTKVLMEVEANEDHDPNFVRSTDLVTDRLEWRQHIDRRLKRLLQDTDLDLDGRLPKLDQHRMRCEHLDRTYDWYTRQGTKEARKERKAPHFLTYDPDGGYMPGSTRKPVHPPKRFLPKVEPSPTASDRSDRSASLPCLLGSYRGNQQLVPSILELPHVPEDGHDEPSSPIHEFQEEEKGILKFPDLAPRMARKASATRMGRTTTERHRGFGSAVSRF
eukprot:TRINITY_DN17802_c0_g1_i1.p2 TRINITY_DN17802_c0_g1~~TRINITY_DN17802_c0_g1_i1.p2  ORF type:complete len:280 (+),score=47.11 TRINITY_DN17802_c0_g1_i1:109-948(+)